MTSRKQQPLTKKALAAIELYASLKAETTGRYQFFMIRHVLTADRMPRDKLYSWLESFGYRWRDGCWWTRGIDGRRYPGYCPADMRPKRRKPIEPLTDS